MTDQEQVQDPKPTDGSHQAPADDGVDFGGSPETTEVENTIPPDEKEETPSEQPEQKLVNQEAIEKRINKLTFEKHEERRKREQMEESFKRLKAELEKQKSAQQDIEVPPMPDLYDDDFEQKLKIREEALSKAAAAQARKQFLEEQHQKELHRKAQEENAKISRQVDEMYKNAKDHGISKEELEGYDQTVSGFIANQNLARFILAQKDSALIVKYLAHSPQEMEQIRGMDDLNASVLIATRIAQEASKLKPGVTRTPAPVDIPEKSSSPQSEFLKGVIFE